MTTYNFQFSKVEFFSLVVNENKQFQNDCVVQYKMCHVGHIRIELMCQKKKVLSIKLVHFNTLCSSFSRESTKI